MGVERNKERRKSKSTRLVHPDLGLNRSHVPWPPWSAHSLWSGGSLPREEANPVNFGWPSYHFQKKTQNNSSRSSSSHKIPWPDSPSFLFSSPPMAGNTKDKSVINYLQMISYSLQLFAHQITMLSTAAQMRQPSLAEPLTTHPRLPPKCLRKNGAGQTPNWQGELWFYTPRWSQLFHFLGLLGPHGETGWEALASTLTSMDAAGL